MTNDRLPSQDDAPPAGKLQTVMEKVANGLSGSYAQLANITAVGAVIALLFLHSNTTSNLVDRMMVQRQEEYAARREESQRYMDEIRQNRERIDQAIQTFERNLASEREHDKEQRELARKRFEETVVSFGKRQEAILQELLKEMKRLNTGGKRTLKSTDDVPTP